MPPNTPCGSFLFPVAFSAAHHVSSVKFLAFFSALTLHQKPIHVVKSTHATDTGEHSHSDSCPCCPPPWKRPILLQRVIHGIVPQHCSRPVVFPPLSPPWNPPAAAHCLSSEKSVGYFIVFREGVWGRRTWQEGGELENAGQGGCQEQWHQCNYGNIKLVSYASAPTTCTRNINMIFVTGRIVWVVNWASAPPVEIGGGGEQMYLRRGPFWWPWQCADAIRSAHPDSAWPVLHQKPLNTAIGWLLAPYCPGGQPGTQSTQRLCKMYPLCWLFQWPSRCAGTIPHASHDGGGLWLS